MRGLEFALSDPFSCFCLVFQLIVLKRASAVLLYPVWSHLLHLHALPSPGGGGVATRELPSDHGSMAASHLPDQCPPSCTDVSLVFLN